LVELWGVEPAGEPDGTLFKEAWSGAGSAGGSIHEAESGDGGGVAGDIESRRSVCAAGSRVSGGAVEVHGGGDESGGGDKGRRGGGKRIGMAGDGGTGCAGGVDGAGLGAGGEGERRESGVGGGGRELGVRGVHVGINGTAEGSNDRAARVGEPFAGQDSGPGVER